MTKLLEKAFSKAAQLPEVEQNSLAKWLIEEIESERKWEKLFADSEDVLETLANEALDALRKGKSKTLDVNEL